MTNCFPYSHNTCKAPNIQGLQTAKKLHRARSENELLLWRATTLEDVRTMAA
jgi:hypothetical protein